MMTFEYSDTIIGVEKDQEIEEDFSEIAEKTDDEEIEMDFSDEYPES